MSMPPGWLILLAALGYLSLLFAVAFYADKRADEGHSLVANPYVYALSIAVYCTSWTFYGSVGRAAQTGVGFLPIYLGPTLTFTLGWFLLRKIVRISKAQRITSIADFIASRYGKSQILGGLVTVIAVVGIMPYISLQLKAVATSFDVLLGAAGGTGALGQGLPLGETALYVTIALAAFSILFGTRHIDATEHHAGMVVAIALESVVKLVAFLMVGAFVTFGMFDGFGDIFTQAAARPELARLMTFEVAEGSWVSLTLLSMAAIICLPRQFQVAVVENVDEGHLAKALWLFPLYLLLINIFVLPIAFGGLLWFPEGEVDADTFVLALPMAVQRPLLTLLVFLGGLSAATAMVIVATVALSTMVCNDLVMPLLLRFQGEALARRRDLSGILLGIRRGAILLILLLGYLYFKLIGESFALVSIGLVSFAAAAQFAPAILGGIYWRGGTHRGALVGLTLGFVVWTYTLLLPSFARSGWLAASFVTDGPLGIALLNPYALFGVTGLDPISHALFWSMLFNAGAYVLVSLLDRPTTIDKIQATVFVEAFSQEAGGAELGARTLHGSASVADLRALAERFVGRKQTERAFAEHARRRGLDLDRTRQGDAEMVRLVERLIAGAIGAASARVMIASSFKGEDVSPEEIMEVLDETSHVLEYSRRLEEKSSALEKATRDLRAANLRLKELDQLKDEFLSTVTHELRTPLTSIRSFSEILHDDLDMPVARREEFLAIVIGETERLTRLINQVLDLTRIEAGRMQWNMETVDMRDVIEASVATFRRIFEQESIHLDLNLLESPPPVRGDRDRLMQVVINLLSNAEKFCPPEAGRVGVTLCREGESLKVRIDDNGSGIDAADRETIFDKFHQIRDGETGNPMGSGLGLAISQRILEHLGGRIRVEGAEPQGSAFIFTVPIAEGSTAE